MQTTLTDSIEIATEFLLAGEVVAFPTETVYGLGANVFDEMAIRKIFLAKGRPSDNPLIAHIGKLEDLQLLASEVTPAAEKFIARFFPGPLTLVLPKQPTISSLATARLNTIGIRMPRHPVAQSLLQTCGVPLVAPSANLSGKPSPTTWQAVQSDLDGRIACILRGEQAEVGLESTVVDCSGSVPVLLRAGAITLEQLQEIVPITRLAQWNASEPTRSPGLKYKHYSPQARVEITVDPRTNQSSTESAFIGLHQPSATADFKRVKVCQTIEEYAQSLFQFFRECDALGIEVIYCEAVSETGLGLALMDRIKRAAHG
ncbi:MAG: threonylcarbamoyl-AMP synthase [Acidobacteria bacterium]|nr:threonylcarbamoyl-AMP synthase [Acidobacteriota bacterium]